jgi:hypothetical protein
MAVSELPPWLKGPRDEICLFKIQIQLEGLRDEICLSRIKDNNAVVLEWKTPFTIP